jgi:hypothetical protein
MGKEGQNGTMRCAERMRAASRATRLCTSADARREQAAWEHKSRSSLYVGTFFSDLSSMKSDKSEIPHSRPITLVQSNSWEIRFTEQTDRSKI